MRSLEIHVNLIPLASHPGIHHYTVKNEFLIQLYLVITSWKRLNILCHYEWVLYPRGMVLWLTVTN